MTKLLKLKTVSLKIAVGLAIFTPVFFMAAALGTKIGLWGWKFGFGKLVMSYGIKLMLLTLLMAIIALAFSVLVKPRTKSWIVALLALAVPVMGIGFGKKVKAKAGSLPFIHDITTDTQNVPTFSNAIIEQRGADSNSLDYVGKRIKGDGELVSVAQVASYPNVQTLILSQSPDTVFDEAVIVLKKMGLKTVTSSKEDGIIEATYTSFWFGFKDDMVVRIKPGQGGGSVVDVRSISRVGGSDIGKNAARIVAFNKALQKALKPAK